MEKLNFNKKSQGRIGLVIFGIRLMSYDGATVNLANVAMYYRAVNGSDLNEIDLDPYPDSLN